jgi:DNA-directed RNA polymerase subunit E'/Rpb7
MEVSKQTPQQKYRKKEIRPSSIYSRCLISKKITLDIKYVGKNLKETLEKYISSNYEGKCVVEGYIKPGSTKIITYSSGLIDRGTNIIFDVVFECMVCFLVAGTLINCVIKNITKAGIRAESATEVPSPIVVFIAREHLTQNSEYFYSRQEKDEIEIRVIGQRFELDDTFISVIGELVKPRKDIEISKKEGVKPKLIIED